MTQEVPPAEAEAILGFRIHDQDPVSESSQNPWAGPYPPVARHFVVGEIDQWVDPMCGGDPTEQVRGCNWSYWKALMLAI